MYVSGIYPRGPRKPEVSSGNKFSAFALLYTGTCTLSFLGHSLRAARVCLSRPREAISRVVAASSAFEAGIWKDWKGERERRRIAFRPTVSFLSFSLSLSGVLAFSVLLLLLLPWWPD